MLNIWSIPFFKDAASVPPKSEKYEKSLVSATADGTSVNFGAYNGLLTKIGATRPWLLKIHCSNHRPELAIKKVFSKKSRIYM